MMKSAIISSAPELIAIMVIPMITGSISFAASLTLIIMILRSNLKLGTVYRRLVFGMSVFDLIQSLSQALSSVPMPAGSFWGSVGNNITCNIQGLMTVTGVSGALFYSLSLSIYFLAMIKFELRDREIKRKIEPFLHIVPIVYSLVGGVTLYATGSLKPAGSICWIGADTSSCDDNDRECIDRREQINIILMWLFSGCPLILVFSANCAAMSTIWWTEYSQSKKSQQYQTSWIQNYQIESPTTKNNSNAQNSDNANTNNANNTNNTNNASVLTSPLAARLSRPSRASIQRRKEISHRAIAFIIGYLMTYTPSLIYRAWEVITSDNEDYAVPYALHLLSRIFFPLQGLFNIIMYTYPHVVTRRDANSGSRYGNGVYSWIRAFWEVVKSGGDKDELRTGRRGGRGGRGKRKKDGALPLRRKSMRNEPVVTDLNEIIGFDQEETRKWLSQDDTGAEVATNSNIEQV